MTTDTQKIEVLEATAGQAGDLLQVAICQIALHGEVHPDTWDQLIGEERGMLADWYGVAHDGTTQMYNADVLAERACLRVIDEAEERAAATLVQS